MKKKRESYDQHVRYNVDTVKHVIISKEKRGGNASYERLLLESWQHYEGYEYASEALRECDSLKLS